MNTPAPLPESAVDVAEKELAAFDALLADLQAKFPDAEVEAYTYSGGRLILRTPDEGSFSQWMDNRAKPVQAAGALCRRCILHPSTAVVDLLFKRKPGLSQRIGDVLLEKAGAGEAITLGK